MFTLSGFADEISPDLEEQMDVMEELDIDYIELRGVNDKNVLDLTDEEIREIKASMNRRGFSVSAIGSPIGKVGIEQDFGDHLERFQRALYLADFFQAPYIRLFSYYIPSGADPADYREEVMRRMKRKTELAEEAGITLLHENEREIYGDTPERCRDILETVDSSHLRAIFDPANFIAIGRQPYPEAFRQLTDFIEYLHIKDAKFEEEGQTIKPAGEGEGRIGEILKELDGEGFEGFLSLEPHLAMAGQMEGFSGPDAFRLAARSLKDVLQEEGLKYK